jgi:hypothetical protein
MAPAGRGRTHATMPAWGIAALALIGELGFIAAVSMLLIYISGWFALGKAYPRPKSAVPEQRRWGISAKIGRIACNRALIVGADRGGLYLGYIPPWSFATPALYIPWSALRFERRWKFWWMPKIRYRTAIGIPIELYGHAAEIAEQYGPRVHLQTL